MKKYLVTENNLVYDDLCGNVINAQLSKLELTPNGRWLTREDIQKVIDSYGTSVQSEKLLDSIFGSDDDDK